MSDCFNHALDAFESMGQDHQDTYVHSRRDHRYNYDPLYYHEEHKVRLIRETEKAFRFKSKKGFFWVPKSLCKRLNLKKGTVFIWRNATINYSKKDDVETK